jgi:hypothetical protein
LPPIDQVVDALLKTVLPPALLVAVLTGLVCLLARWNDSVAYAGSALAIACGLILGCASTWLAGQIDLVNQIIHNQLPWVPLAEGWNWLLTITLAALATDAVARLPRVPTGVGWALRGMVAAEAGWLLAPVALRAEYSWSPVAFGVVVLAEWALLAQLGRIDRRGLVPLLLAGAANVASLVLLLYADEARFGFVAMVLMAVLAGVGVAALIFGREANGAAAAVAVLLPGLMLSGQQDTPTEVPIICFALVALSPLALAPSLLPAWRCYQKKGLWVVQLLLLMAPLAWALFLAAQTGSLNPDDETRAPIAHPAEFAQSRK